ncbi:MAG: hypothetical protein ABSH48_11640 [Verrucomicrobiota bacterium]|jgi:hypothetical protein
MQWLCMKLSLVIAIGGAAMMVAGCVTSPQPVVLDPVGPAPSLAAKPTGASGMLSVYSAYQASADFNNRDPYRREYSDYRILRADGTLVQQVHNTSGSILQRPAQVPLPAGNYRVVAQANSYGEVTVPVVIAGGRDTLVHLEGGYAWPNPHAFNEANSVRLPDGEVVGWRDSTVMK